MQVSLFSNASDIVNIASRSILSSTDFFITRSSNSSTRIAGASRSSEATEGTPCGEDLRDQVGVEDRAGAVPGRVDRDRPGVGLDELGRASSRSTTRHPSPSRWPAWRWSSWLPTWPWRPELLRTTTSIALSLASSTRPRALPGRLSFTASQSEAARPVSHTKWTGNAPLAFHHSTWRLAMASPAALPTRPPCAQMTSGYRLRAARDERRQVGVEDRVDVGLRRLEVGDARRRGRRPLRELPVRDVDDVGMQGDELVPGQVRRASGAGAKVGGGHRGSSLPPPTTATAGSPRQGLGPDPSGILTISSAHETL